MSEKQETAIDMVVDIKNQVDELVREIATKDAEIATLKAALKPVLECDIDFDPWSWMGDSLDNDQMDSVENMHNAVREAQRIMNEGGAK